MLCIVAVLILGNEQRRFGLELRDLSRIKAGHIGDILSKMHCFWNIYRASVESLTSTLSFKLDFMALFFSG